MEEQALAILNQGQALAAEQGQALAIFKQAAEQMRFNRSQQWQVTYYTMIAYAALVAAPLAVPRGGWRDCVTVFSAVLVVLAAWQAGRTLWYLEDMRLTERDRLVEVTKEEHLSLIHEIYEKHQPSERWERPPQVWMPERPPFPWGLLFAVVLGALFAITIIIPEGEVKERSQDAVRKLRR